MKVVLKAGAEVDLLTQEELRDVMREASSWGQPDSELARAEAQGATDAAGALVLPFYRVPQGMEARIHVARIEADGFTEAVPFNGAGAFYQLRVGERVFDGASLVAGAARGEQLPTVKTYGFMQGGAGLNQENFDVRLVAGPANTLVRVFAQLTLIPRPGKPAEQ